MTKQFVSKPIPDKAKYIYKLGRPELTRFIGISTGHNRQAYFQSLLNENKDPWCQLCFEENETFWHFATE
jgi:hypothetical protein